MTEEPDVEKSYARQHRDLLHEVNKIEVGMLQNVEGTLKRMESFCKTKKNMFLPIRKGIGEALRELARLRNYMENTDFYLDHFKYHLRNRVASKIKDTENQKKKDVIDESSQTPPQPVPRSTPEPRKRQREPTVSPQETVTKKPGKRPRTSKKEGEWVEVPARKELRKKGSKPGARKPEKLGITVQRIRETRSKGLLVEMRCAAKDRDRLDSGFRDVVGEQGTDRHLVPMTQVEILDQDGGGGGSEELSP